jgi:UPF0755 protein
MRRLISIFAAAAVLLAVLAILAIGVLRSTANVFRITVIEGLTVAQMLDSLGSQTGFTVEELTVPLLDGTVVSSLRLMEPQELSDWEGLLFPDTYEVTDRDEPADILQLLADTAESRVGSVDWSFIEQRGLTAYDGIVIGSSTPWGATPRAVSPSTTSRSTRRTTPTGSTGSLPPRSPEFDWRH